MNFLHYTVIPQNDFLFSIALKSSSTTKIEVLLAYKNRIEFGLIFTAKDRISLDIRDSFYLGSPIIWATVCDDHMVSITESNHLKITTIYPTFDLIFDEGIEQQNLKYFSISWNRQFICAACEQSNFLLIDINNLEMPLFYFISLEKGNILDITADKNDNLFAFLVEDGDQKFTIIYDAQQKKIVKTIDEEKDSISYIHSLDPKSREFYILHPNYITCESKTILTTESEIKNVSKKLNDIIHFSLSDGTLLTYSIKNDSQKLYFNSPEIDEFYCLPNFILLCKTTEKSIFLMRTSENKKSTQTEFKEIEKFYISDTTYIKQLYSYSNQLYFSDKSGNFHRICRYFNKNKAKFLKQFEFEVSLLSFKEELFYTNPKLTRVINEYKTTSNFPSIIADKHTISFLYFRKKVVQVISDGLYCEGNCEVDFSDSCILASSKGDQLVCVLNTNEIVLFEKTFKNKSSFEIDLDGALITAVDVSAKFIAVASFHDEMKIGQIFLLDFDFNGFGEEFSFPSKITNVFFRKNDSELYIVSENGSIAKCLITKEKGITPEISYIFFGDIPHSISFKDEDSFSFISNSKLYFYSNDKILETSLNNINSIAFSGTYFFFVDNKLRLYSMQSNEITEKFDVLNISSLKNIIQIEFFLDFLFILDNQGLHVKKTPEKSNKIFDIDTFKIENGKSLILFQKSQRNPQSIRIVVLTENNVFLYFKFCCNLEDSKLILLNENRLRFQIKMIRNWFDFIFIVLENGSLAVCKFIKKELLFMRQMIERNMPITNIEINKNYIWIVFGQKIISVFIPNFDCEQLDLVAEDDGFYPSNLTKIQPIDELTVAVCYEDGLLCIKEIDNNVAHGFYIQNERKFLPPKLNELNRINFNSEISSIFINNNFLAYSTVNGGVGFLIPITSNSVFQNLFIMQKKMKISYNNQIGICSLSCDSLCATKGIIDYDFIKSYINFDKNTDLLQFFDTTSLTCLLQYINL